MKEDISKSTYAPLSEEQMEVVNPTVIRFNSNGVDDQDKEKRFQDKDSCCMVLDYGTKRIYRVKAKNANRSHLYNPTIDRGDEFKYREVSKVCFNHYLNFLKTKMESNLKLAKRECM